MSTLTTPQSPRAFLLSTLLHVSVVVLLLLFAWWSKKKVEETPQIFELVAGEGMDYQAKEAPTTAAAAPAIKVDVPQPLPPVVTPKAQPKAVETPPPPKVELKKETPPPKKETPPPPKVDKAPPVKIEKAPPKMKFEDFAKKHPQKTPQAKAPPPIKAKTIDADSIAGRVASSTTNTVKAGAAGTAMTAAEEDLWGRYQAMLLQRIRAALLAAGIADNRSARVEFRLSAGGAISNARIIRSSGSGEFDAAVLQAFRSIGALGPPPTGGAQTLAVEVNLHERT
jgi:colicin import membrane protein